eukprot:Skav224069  [mRNA]  locus=scaffold432:49200:52519:+ [translate_table: standard]
MASPVKVRDDFQSFSQKDLEPSNPVPVGDGIFSMDHSESNRAQQGSGKKSEPSQGKLWGMGDMANWVNSHMDHIFLDRETSPTGRTFPLPTSMDELTGLFPNCSSVGLVLVVALNSFNGEGTFCDSKATDFQVQILEGLRSCCHRVAEWTERETEIDWHEFFRTRGIDYKGDEVLTAQSITWSSISPALPDGVGGVALEELVKLGTLHYVNNFTQFLLPKDSQVYVRPPKVMVPEGEWETLCKGLMDKGVFGRIHEDQVYKVDGRPVLNGLFGVGKQEFTSSGEEEALKKAALGGEHELRKDKTFPMADPLYKVYLDNYDELSRISKEHSSMVSGQVSALTSCLQEVYLEKGLPRHPKKSVAQATKAEVQGAILDGVQGIAYPKPAKVLRYAGLAQRLLETNQATQKQMQVVTGGLVYIAMFRRPLLGSLHHVWQFIKSFEGFPPVVKLPLPEEVKHELLRFLGLLPLAFVDFRTMISPQVTASDASTTGGGVTVSQRTTVAGMVAAQCPVRGDLVEPSEITQVLTVGLFDGISGLRVAVDALGWNVVGHISVEKQPEASRVVESNFADTIFVPDVADITADMVKDWSLKFGQVGLVVLGAGPPCQGVSGLNASKKGALKDQRSCLFVHVQRVRELLKAAFPWAQVRSLMESVASMNSEDEGHMTESYGGPPVFIDACDVSVAHRPRLYWIDWEIEEDQNVQMSVLPSGRTKVQLKAALDASIYFEPGWKRTQDAPMPTFTTARPMAKPGYKPAGLHTTSELEKQAWEADLHRFPPYQNQRIHCLTNKAGEYRLANCNEREVAMGFPKGYTRQCLSKARHDSTAHSDMRLSLLGNSWNVTVVAWLLSQLGALLGLNNRMSPQEVVARTAPGSTASFQGFLLRPTLAHKRPKGLLVNERLLIRKLMTLVSIKGDDLLLQPGTEDTVKYQRLRTAVPSKLWKWRTVAGWHWKNATDHINVLEMRAAFTALRWRIEQKKCLHHKFVHLLDSLVCLHSL